jgi:hypothetical protein
VRNNYNEPARENNVYELITNGADFVVEDLSEINVDDINKLISSKPAGKLVQV